jgi:hypothetical protein
MTGRVDLSQACSIAQVKPGTIRQWVNRGVVVRYPDGYDVYELLLWLDQTRNDGKAAGAAMAAHVQYQERWIA